MDLEQWVSFSVAALAVVSSTTTAGLALRYARKQVQAAQEQLDLNRKIEREKNEPYVIVDIHFGGPGSFALYLTIQNVGPTLARNVQISVDPPIESTHEQATEALRTALSRTIPMLPPGRKLEYFFDTNARLNSGLPMTYDFTVKAMGPVGNVEPLRYTVDIEVLSETLIGERPTKQIEAALTKIEKPLKEIAKSYADANHTSIAQTRQERMDAMLRRREDMTNRLQAQRSPDE
jgi:hypothetical protein